MLRGIAPALILLVLAPPSGATAKDVEAQIQELLRERMEASGMGDSVRVCAIERRIEEASPSMENLRNVARCEQGLGHRVEALALWRKVIALSGEETPSSAYVALAQLGVRLPGPDLSVTADRDPSSYKSTCHSFIPPGTCGPGIFACTQFNDDDQRPDGRREVHAYLWQSPDRAQLERIARSRDPYVHAAGGGFRFATFVYNCLPRDRCAPMDCSGLKEDAAAQCRERAREACDAELAKCPTPPSVTTAGDCAVVFVGDCPQRVGYVCGGVGRELVPSREPPPPRPETYDGDVSAGVRACCVGRHKEPGKLPPAKELLDAFRLGDRPIPGRQYVFQSDIAEALIARGDRSVIPALQQLLQSESRETKVNAAWVLARLGDDEGLPLVMAEARDDSPDGRGRNASRNEHSLARQIEQDRYYAVRTLGMIGDRRATPLLVELLDDKSLDYEAAYALSLIGDRSAIPAIRKAAISARDQSRLSLASALAKLGDPYGGQLLGIILRDAAVHSVYRERAAEALGDARVVPAIPVLIEALRDPSIDVRLGAARALGEMGDPSAIPALTEALSDAAQTATHGPPITVRDAAQAAIATIKKSLGESAAPPPP